MSLRRTPSPRRTGHPTRSLVAALGAALVGTMLSSAPAQAVAVSEPYVVPASGAIPLTGHGYGHGSGMSQYGARGAAQAGLNHAQIVAFYYPGTAMGSAGGTMKVRLSADTDRVLEVAPGSGLRFKRVGTRGSRLLPATLAGARVTSWRARAVSGGTVVEGLAGRWRVHPQGTMRGVVAFFGPSAVTLRTGSTQRAYRGALRYVQGTTVNAVAMEDYLRGVVPREIPASWEIAAVRAQAVAARSYAAWERANKGSRAWDSCDTTSCQVYGGVADEHPLSNAAVAATSGQIRTYQGRPAFTQFGSSSGGWLKKGSVPYLVSKRDAYDATRSNPNHTWRTSLTRARVQAAYPGLGTLRRVVVTQRNGDGDWGGRVERVVLDGSRSDVALSGTSFRSVFGLKSDWFKVG